MNQAPLQDRGAAIWARVANLNGWQRGAVAVTAAIVAYYQFNQVDRWGYEADAWFIGFALAGMLVFVALTSRPPITGVNVWQRIVLGVTAAGIAVIQLGRFDVSGGGLGWAGAFLTAGAFVVAAAATGRKRKTGDDQPSEARIESAAAAAVPVASASAPSGASASPLPKRTYFKETDVDQFIAACHALAEDIAPTLLHPGMPTVPALAGYVEEVALAYSYGVCSFVACVHNQQWPKSKGSAAVTERIVADLTKAAMKGEIAEITEEKARTAVQEVAAEYLKRAGIAAYMFCKLSNDESHQLVRGLVDAAKAGKQPDLVKRAPTGKQVLAAWLADPESGENHLAYVQGILGKAVGAEFQGEDFRERLEALYGPLTRKMIERALALMRAPLTEDAVTPAAPGVSEPEVPPNAEIEALVARHRKLLADAHSSGDPRDFTSGLEFCPPESAGALNKGLWVCGCCWAPFMIDPEKVGMWFSFDHKGGPAALCAVCLEFLNHHHVRQKGGSKRFTLAAEYDAMGQQLAEKFPGQLPAKVAALRMAVIENREKASR